MKRWNGDVIVKSIKKDMVLYLTAIIFLLIGLAVGSITVKVLDFNQKKDLIVYLNSFFQIIGNESVKSSSIFYQSFKNNFQTVFFIWLLSITVIGIPVTLFIIGFRGFILGFTISLFIEGIGWKGVLLSIIGVLPQNIIYIPCIIGIAALSLKFSLNVLKRNLSNGVVKQYKSSILSYTVYVIIIFLIMGIGTVIEAYITPILLKLISSYIITIT